MNTKLQAFKQRQGHDIGGVRPVMIPDDAGEWVSRHDAEHQIERIIAQRDALLAALEPFAQTYYGWNGVKAMNQFGTALQPEAFRAAAEAIDSIKGGAE